MKNSCRNDAMSARRPTRFPRILRMDRIENVEHLETLLSEPTPHAIETLTRLPGDLMLLGVAGKIGPTLSRLARRASDQAGTRRRILGVARCFNPKVERRLQAFGLETIRRDLLDEAQLSTLPDVPNVIAMFGMKFGST